MALPVKPLFPSPNHQVSKSINALDAAHFGTYSLGDSRQRQTPPVPGLREGSDTIVSAVPAAALGLPSLGTCSAAPVAIYRLLFNRFCTLGALLALPLAALLPSDGAGIPVCWFQALSGLPCPGCGLTRAFSSLLHGQVQAAFAYHPFVFLLLPLFGIMAAHNFLPARARQGLERFCHAHDRILRVGYRGMVYSLVVFGVLRMLACAWGWQGV